jgi:hypothetical protein
MSPDMIIMILQIAAQTLAQVESGNVVGKDAAIAEALIAIYQKSASAYQAVQGKPIDEALVPEQKPIPTADVPSSQKTE